MSVEQPADANHGAAAPSSSADAGAAKPRISRNVKIGAAAAAGIGSAAIVAALLYANRTRQAEPAPARGAPEDKATD